MVNIYSGQIFLTLAVYTANKQILEVKNKVNMFKVKDRHKNDGNNVVLMLF